MVKKAISLIFAAMMSLFVLCSCGDEWEKEKEIREKSSLTEIEEAYESGYFRRGDMLTKDNLIDLAYHINNGIAYEGEVDEETKQAIKEYIARQLKSTPPYISEAKADGVTIQMIYGCYSGIYIVKAETIYTTHSTDVPPPLWAEIDGVAFFYEADDDFYMYIGNEWKKAHYDKGSLPKIEKVYEEGLLTKNDLKDLAYHINNGIAYEEEVGEETKQAIKEDIARQLREGSSPIPEAEAEGITIEIIYGHYSESYVVVADTIYFNFPAVVMPDRWTEIDGVEFFYPAYFYLFVCKIG